MFSKEYTFETKHTRFKRITFNLVLVSSLSLIIFTALCFYLPHFSKLQTKDSSELFFQKSPDLITVFTGDKGRILKGIELAKKYPEAKFLISGVHINNSYMNILNAQDLQEKTKDIIEKQAHQLEIDYQARNTLENVISTLHYLRENNSFKRILVVSSDYHLFRINMLFQNLISTDDFFKIGYYGIKMDYSSWRNQKILIKEVVKVVKTYLFLLFWNHE